MQEVIIFLIFAVALGYLGLRAYRSFFARKSAGCGKGCGCAADTNAKSVTTGKQIQVPSDNIL